MKIFISYRREDSQWAAHKLYDAIKTMTSEQNSDVFIDVDKIPFGEDFEKHLASNLAQCEVLLALLGPHWLRADSKTGARRLDDSKDFVRIEIATALKRGIRVVPVLLDDTRIPKEEELPDDLKPLAKRQGVPVALRTFETDVAQLIDGLATTGEPSSGEPILDKYERRAFSPAKKNNRSRVVSGLALVGAIMIFVTVAIGLATNLLDFFAPTTTVVLQPTPDNNTITTRTVQFAWPSVNGAVSYNVQVRGDLNMGTAGGFLWTRVDSARLSADLGFIHRTYVGTRFYWATQPVFAGEVTGDWASTANFVYDPPLSELPMEQAEVPDPPIPPEQVRIEIDFSRDTVVADGDNTILVRAVVTDLDGLPVEGANVRFYFEEIVYSDGELLAGDEPREVERPYEPIPSGGFVIGETLSNQVDRITDAQGEAFATYRTPVWQFAIGKKPVVLGVWYHMDGGGNPQAFRRLYLSRE